MNEYMKEAIDLSSENLINKYGGPFGAVIVKDGKIIGRGCNRVIIDKDPRDLYILAKKALGIRGRFIPTDSVDSFIDYYKAIMTYSAKTNEMSPNILHIHFEDLIYDTDHSIARIKSFLRISGDMDKKTEFYPEKSINNTQLFRRYPEYGRDIERIEQELACWLYDFSRFDMTPTFNGKQF